MIVLVPLFVFVYKNAYRKVLISTFIFVAVFGSFIPTFYISYKYEINSFPGYMSNGFSSLFMKTYYRMPPFMLGIALAIMKFEYKFVGTLNDGTTPFHKILIEKMKQNISRKFIGYVAGLLLILFSVFILISDTTCINNESANDLAIYNLNFCWSPMISAFYNSFGQFFFFIGMILIILPSLVNYSNILRPLMDSHLWHVLEELTFCAYMLQFLVVTWFFASR